MAEIEDIKSDIEPLRKDTRADISNLRRATVAEIEDIKSDIKLLRKDTRADIEAQESRLMSVIQAQEIRLIKWMVDQGFAVAGIIIAAVKPF